MQRGRDPDEPAFDLVHWVRSISWPLLLIPGLLAGAGYVMLASLGAGNPALWAHSHAIKFAFGCAVLVFISMVHIRHWKRLAFPGYLACLAILMVVSFQEASGEGVVRWIEFGGFRLQPSEPVKLALIATLAALYTSVPREPEVRFLAHVAACVLIAIPVLMVLRQPDLGTALLVAAGGFGIMFLAGLPLFVVGGCILCGVAGLAAVFHSQGTSWQLLKDYQYDRIASFLDPAGDPLGAGYHSAQSLIAFGSGGFWGAGYMRGPQSSLDFLPEKHTDFLFAALAEEFGFVGSFGVLVLHAVLLVFLALALWRMRDAFSRLLTAGVALMIFLFFAVNAGMVMGLLPVVGVPLPLLSHGGSAMLTVLIALGLVQSALASRHAPDDSGRSRP